MLKMIVHAVVEPRLSIPDFVLQFCQSCKPKSGMESLGSRVPVHIV